MKSLAIVFCLLSVVCFGMGNKPPRPTQPAEVEVVLPAPDYVKINVVKLTGFSPAQEVRFRGIIARTERVINSQNFKAKVLTFQHKGKVQFFDTLDSNQTVLNKILSKSWDLEYRLEYMRKGTKTIGYTLPNVKWIALNARKFDSLSDKELSKNIIHEEGGHKIGRYNHSKYNDSNRPSSVPYGLGFIGSELF